MGALTLPHWVSLGGFVCIIQDLASDRGTEWVSVTGLDVCVNANMSR